MRLFQAILPSIGDYVKVRIIEHINVAGAKAITCQLVHYDNADALMLHAEAITKKNQRIEKIHKIDSEIICEVLKIDGSNIDLSFRRVTIDDQEENNQLFSELERVVRIIEFIVKKYHEYYIDQLALTDEQIFETLFWKKIEDPESYNIDLNHYYDSVLENPNIIFDDTDIFEETFINTTIEKLKSSITIVPYKIHVDFGLRSFAGVESIKTILNEVFTDETIELHSLPTYRIVFTANTMEEVQQKMEMYNNKLKESCQKNNAMCHFNVEKYTIVHERNLLLSI